MNIDSGRQEFEEVVNTLRDEVAFHQRHLATTNRVGLALTKERDTLRACCAELERQRDELLADLKRLAGLAKIGATPLHNYRAAVQQSLDLIAKYEAKP